jgi:hypothetical protein
MGKYGIQTPTISTYYELQNVNLGVEAANLDTDLQFDVYTDGTKATLLDVKLGGTNGDVNFTTAASRNSPAWGVKSVNHNKVLGAYKQWFSGMVIEKTAVSGATPNKKLSDFVIELIPETTNALYFIDRISKMPVFRSRKTYDAGTYNIKVWIFNATNDTNSGQTLNDTTAFDDIFLQCRSEAAGYGDATTEYVSKWYYSDEIDIEPAANADDWDYLQADSVVVDTDGAHIYCEVKVSTYDADADSIFIDPVTVNP